MKKQNLAALIMGIVGGIPFMIGMVLALVEEWNMLVPGIVSGAIGLVVLLAIIPVYRRLAGKEKIKFNGKTILAVAIGIIGTLMLGVGMSMCLLGGTVQYMVIGMVVGLIGIVIAIINYPIFKTRVE